MPTLPATVSIVLYTHEFLNISFDFGGSVDDF